MISFRVSEREFEMLKTKSEAEGARSVSEFARIALCGTRDTAPAPPTGGDFERLRAELQELGTFVRRLAEMLEPKRAAVPNRSSLATVDRKN